MGPPMSYKTGAVVESYPKPMLVFEFDIGGLDVVKQPIERLAPVETFKLREYCKKPIEQLPKILAVEFGTAVPRMLNLTIKTYESLTAIKFADLVNEVVVSGCPWRTVVLDPMTGLNEAFFGQIGVTDSAAMNDARQWAFKVGVLVQRTIMVLQGLPCHTVFIMHSETEKNDITGEIITEPMIPSKFRQRAASMFSQFFYAAIEGGKPVVYAQPTGFVKSVGMRRPEASPAKMGALFNDIYGKDYE